MNDLNLGGSYAVITGAADGIGRALAFEAAKAGMKLAIADINEAGLRAVAAELESLDVPVLTHVLDITSAAATDAFADAVFAWADGPVTIVFANAGIHGLCDGLRPDLKVWNRVVNVNLFGAVHTVHAFMPRLLDQGTAAQFVITASQAAFVAAPGMSPYIATKHALWGLADSLRLELKQIDTPVGISIVAPSRAASGITRSQAERARQAAGDSAAAAYEAQLVGSDKIAEVMLREARKRAFWIVPSHESVLPVLQARIDTLIAAFPAGEIRVDR